MPKRSRSKDYSDYSSYYSDYSDSGSYYSDYSYSYSDSEPEKKEKDRKERNEKENKKVDENQVKQEATPKDIKPTSEKEEKKSKSKDRSSRRSHSRRSRSRSHHDRHRSHSHHHDYRKDSKKPRVAPPPPPPEPQLLITPEVNTSRAGGVYIPPFRLARMQQNIDDKSSPEYQRRTWEALRKSLNGIINKVNVVNIGNIIQELFEENLVRGRGLFCRALMKAQLTSPGFTHVYAALIAIVNTKLPEVGELLLKRVVFQFRRAFKRNDKLVAVALSRFIAHLVNQQVSSEVLVLELIFLLLEHPTNDSVEIAVSVTKECGQYLLENSRAELEQVFDNFRHILQEGEIDKRTQYVIEQLFAARRTNFEEYPRVAPELDLVEDGDQVTHSIKLEDKIDKEEHLDVFQVDPNYLENEEMWKKIKASILGEESSSEEEEEEEEEESEESEEEEEGDNDLIIQDQTDQDSKNLKRTIYLLLSSSLGFEECTHKLLKMDLREGQEQEVCDMIVETCNHEQWINQFYPNIAQRLCMIDKKWQDAFVRCFETQFEKLHQLETKRVKINAMFFAYLFSVDCLPWEVLSIIHLTENDTTSSSRIFIKELLQKMSNLLGLTELNRRLKSPELYPKLVGLFPNDNIENVRFAINFITSCGLGGLTEELRQVLDDLRAKKKAGL